MKRSLFQLMVVNLGLVDKNEQTTEQTAMRNKDTIRHKRSLHTNFWFVEDLFRIDVLDGCQTIPISFGKHHQFTDSNELDFGFDNVPLFGMRMTVT